MLIHKELKATLQLEDGDITIPTQLEWSDTDPLAVKVNLYDPQAKAWVRWEFALDLLVMGLTAVSPSCVGSGDVQVQSGGAGLARHPISDRDAADQTDSLDLCKLSLRSPEGTAEVSMDWDTVQWFVGRIVTEFSKEDEAKAVAAQVDMFLREMETESF